MDDDASAEELKRQQQATERLEREGMAEAANEAELAAHRRRADKAAYLQDKLSERERSEEELSEGSQAPPADDND